MSRTKELGLETRAEVLAYLASRGETVEQHEHMWLRWDAWTDWGWSPFLGSELIVCEVPDCTVVQVRK